MPPAPPQDALALAGRAPALYLTGMSRVFDMDDRARLRERFFGATVMAVLARP
jgi:hypothetical protein